MNNEPVFKMKGTSDELEVFEDKLTITPKGVLGLMTKGLQGTKTIPFSSITAIQFKKSGLVSGYIQFTLHGGKESTGGAFAAATDENSFMFSGQNEMAEKVRDYIEERVQAIKALPAAGSDAVSKADEIRKYKALADDGIISMEEFEQKKKQLLGL
ncbi:MAG: DUF4429 domain-containing protein [Spirochaetales bacterium]|jgi:hypothetical protein|nr:DUF4429 domain-containing protein [Spirochaetales bacterium]